MLSPSQDSWRRMQAVAIGVDLEDFSWMARVMWQMWLRLLPLLLVGILQICEKLPRHKHIHWSDAGCQSWPNGFLAGGPTLA